MNSNITISPYVKNATRIVFDVSKSSKVLLVQYESVVATSCSKTLKSNE